MVAAPPASAVTTPEVVTVAIVAALLPQVPPAVASVKGAELPAHKTAVPDMAAGDGSTVTMVNVVQPPPSE